MCYFSMKNFLESKNCFIVNYILHSLKKDSTIDFPTILTHKSYMINFPILLDF